MANKFQSPAILLVEGKDDFHVVVHLCQAYNLKNTFEVIGPKVSIDDDGGFQVILDEQLPLQIKAPDMQAIGIVVDADTDIKARWAALLDRLQKSGYKNLPEIPDINGQIITTTGKPKIGIWIMPNNEITGMLEDFVIDLIPANDPLRPMIDEHLQQVEAKGLNRYNKTLHHSKAFIHAWLACQESPGRPMGQAITCKYLDPEQPLAAKFTAWLKELFDA